MNYGLFRQVSYLIKQAAPPPRRQPMPPAQPSPYSPGEPVPDADIVDLKTYPRPEHPYLRIPQTNARVSSLPGAALFAANNALQYHPFADTVYNRVLFDRFAPFIRPGGSLEFSRAGVRGPLDLPPDDQLAYRILLSELIGPESYERLLKLAVPGQPLKGVKIVPTNFFQGKLDVYQELKDLATEIQQRRLLDQIGKARLNPLLRQTFFTPHNLAYVSPEDTKQFLDDIFYEQRIAERAYAALNRYRQYLQNQTPETYVSPFSFLPGYAPRSVEQQEGDQASGLFQQNQAQKRMPNPPQNLLPGLFPGGKLPQNNPAASSTPDQSQLPQLQSGSGVGSSGPQPIQPRAPSIPRPLRPQFPQAPRPNQAPKSP